MRFARALLAAFFTLLVLPAALFAQTDASGYWELLLATPQGETSVTLALIREESALTGTMGTPFGTVPVSGTSMDEALVLGTRVAGTIIDIDLRATMEDETLDGTVRFGTFGEFPFKGRRVPPPPPPRETALEPISDLNGRWNLKLSIAGVGELPASAVFKQEREKVTGVVSNILGEIVVSGTVVGKSLKMDFLLETPQGDIPVTLNGEIGETSINGKAVVPGVGEANWSATRAVEK